MPKHREGFSPVSSPTQTKSSHDQKSLNCSECETGKLPTKERSTITEIVETINTKVKITVRQAESCSLPDVELSAFGEQVNVCKTRQIKPQECDSVKELIEQHEREKSNRACPELEHEETCDKQLKDAFEKSSKRIK